MALKEVCVAAVDYPSGRTLAGDIVYIREPRFGVGMKTGQHALVFLMDEKDIPEGPIDKNDPMRLGILLEDLVGARIDVDFEMDKCACPNTFYQPFYDCCPKTGKANDRRERPIKVKIESRLARGVRKIERQKQEHEHGKQPAQRGQ